MKDLLPLLNKASENEIRFLAELVKARNTTLEEICRGITRHQGWFDNVWIGRDYLDSTRFVCKRMKIQFINADTIQDLEEKITLKLFINLEKELSIEQWEELCQEIKKHDRSLINIDATTFYSLLLIGKLGKFSTYLFASTVLGSLTHTLGFSMPVVPYYTSMSSAINCILGPAGWTLAGIYTILKINEPNDGVLIKVALYVSTLRYKYQINESYSEKV